MKRYHVIWQCVCCLWILLVFPASVSADELNKEAKAKMFNEILAMPVWCETTVDLAQFKGGKVTEQARAIALSNAEAAGSKLFIEKIVNQKELQITPQMVEFISLVQVIGEDNTGNYGKKIKIRENGKTISQITYRFKVQCRPVGEINPFITKPVEDKQGFIKEVKEYSDYWEIVAAGYGFYEGFEDIDPKIRIAAMRALDSGYGAIINKVIELGITDELIHEKIREKIKENQNYAGVYEVPGCGVKLELLIPVRISKKDATISFVYK